MIREAQYYIRLGEQMVRCQLCPANCRLKPGRRGICKCRYNDNGRLWTDNYGETVTVAIDPIEKKPLYHFYPCGDIVSIGVNGCNLSCRHCQNWQISQEKVRTTFIAPEELPEVAAQRGSVGVAYTYTEPIIWYEYIIDAAPYIRKAGLLNVMVSNGYINPEPLRRLLPMIDAFNIDLKGMRPEFYRRVCRGKMDAVLESISMIAESPSHLEVTNLVIPGLNDGDDDFHSIGKFLASLDKSIPLHLSAYHPSYKSDNPPTPKTTLERAYDIIKNYLSHVFVGNMEIEGCSSSYCPSCGNVLIERSYYAVNVTGIDENRSCRECGVKTDIIFGKE